MYVCERVCVKGGRVCGGSGGFHWQGLDAMPPVTGREAHHPQPRPDRDSDTETRQRDLEFLMEEESNGIYSS